MAKPGFVLSVFGAVPGAPWVSPRRKLNVPSQCFSVNLGSRFRCPSPSLITLARQTRKGATVATRVAGTPPGTSQPGGGPTHHTTPGGSPDREPSALVFFRVSRLEWRVGLRYVKVLGEPSQWRDGLVPTPQPWGPLVWVVFRFVWFGVGAKIAFLLVKLPTLSPIKFSQLLPLPGCCLALLVELLADPVLLLL